MSLLRMFAMLFVVFGAPCTASAAWEPENPVELVVPAAVDTRIDQMARLIQRIIVQHKLMKQDLVVSNKSAGAGAEGLFLLKYGYSGPTPNHSVHGVKADPHRILIASNGLFTVPLATGVPFNWKEVSPVALLALEPFILWTQTLDGYGSALEYINATKAAGPNRMRMRGTGARQEDQFLTVLIERFTGIKFLYRSFKPPHFEQLAEEFDSALYKPIEGESLWRNGTLTPQCVFNDARLTGVDKVSGTRSWSDIPTCKEAGIDVVYQSPSSIHMGPGVTDEQVNYFIALFKKVVETAEWKAYMEQGAYSQRFLTGQALKNCLSRMEEFHKEQLTEHGFISKGYVSRLGVPRSMHCDVK